MGRIIGDGGTAFQIVDVCVHPAHQGRGLGKRIMAALTERKDRLLSLLPCSCQASKRCRADSMYPK